MTDVEQRNTLLTVMLFMDLVYQHIKAMEVITKNVAITQIYTNIIDFLPKFRRNY